MNAFIGMTSLIRHDAGKTVFKYDDFSILNFIQKINNLFHSQIDEKKQTLTTKKNIRHEWVNGDQLHLMQIFSNLRMRGRGVEVSKTLF